jgi:hypothetical protein
MADSCEPDNVLSGSIKGGERRVSVIFSRMTVLQAIILLVCSCRTRGSRVYPKLSDNEIYAYNNKHSLRSNTKGYSSKIH